jgi:hypothetical protein
MKYVTKTSKPINSLDIEDRNAVSYGFYLQAYINLDLYKVSSRRRAKKLIPCK